MIEVVPETGSTNADLARRLRAGEHVAEGFWLRALRQTSGRGRRGRAWLAPEGNLTCSTVVNLRAGDAPAHSLAFVAALAVYDVVVEELEPRTQTSPKTPVRVERSRDTLAPRLRVSTSAKEAEVHPERPACRPAEGLDTNGGVDDHCSRDGPPPPCLLKWPNDVLVDGAKVAGILLERVGDAVVAGIGINIASAPEVPGRATTSLHDAGATADAAELLESLAARFAVRLRQWRGECLAAVLAEWQRRATPVGTPLMVTLDDEGELRGAFAGLDPEGALRLRLADGSLGVVHAGDVSLV